MIGAASDISAANLQTINELADGPGSYIHYVDGHQQGSDSDMNGSGFPGIPIFDLFWKVAVMR